MKYLIYSTYELAFARAEAEGQAQNLPAWRDPATGVTRYISLPRETASGEWALDVNGYQLSEAEQGEAVTEVEWTEPEEEF